ncbi:MAG: DNA-binding response regulator, partial [Armatimonadetes bacterium]
GAAGYLPKPFSPDDVRSVVLSVARGESQVPA